MTLQATSGHEPGEVERVVERVYARPEFTKDERTLMDDILEWISEQFDVDVDPSAAGGLLDGGMRVVLFLIGIALAWLLLRFARDFLRQRSKLRSDAQAEKLAVHNRVRELYRGALQARAAGDFRLAVRLGLFALVTGLGMKGSLEYRDAWTYREILKRGLPDASVSGLLAELIEELEAKEFGEMPVTEADLDRLEALCSEHMGAVLEGDS